MAVLELKPIVHGDTDDKDIDPLVIRGGKLYFESELEKEDKNDKLLETVWEW